MNGGVFQVANTNGLVSPSFEEFGALSGANVNSIVENGLADSTNSLILGGGNGARGVSTAASSATARASSICVSIAHENNSGLQRHPHLHWHDGSVNNNTTSASVA